MHFVVSTVAVYSRTPLIWKLVIRISNYPDRIGPSSKHFLTVIVYLLLLRNFPPFVKYVKKLYINVLFVCKPIRSLKHSFADFFFSTSYCQCRPFSKKNPIIRIFCLSGWLAVPINPNKWSSTVCYKRGSSDWCYCTRFAVTRKSKRNSRQMYNPKQ